MSRHPDHEPIDTSSWTVERLLRDAVETGDLVEYVFPTSGPEPDVVVYVASGEMGRALAELVSRQRLWWGERQADAN